MTGGVAALTLLVNATTSQWVLERLGLVDAAENIEKKIMYSYAKKRLRWKVSSIVEQLQQHRGDLFDLKRAAKYCSILNEDEATVNDLDGFHESPELPEYSSAELTPRVRKAFLEVVRVSYWKQISTGKLPRKSFAALTLLGSIDAALEQCKLEEWLLDWQSIVDSNRFLFPQREGGMEAVTPRGITSGRSGIGSDSVHGDLGIVQGSYNYLHWRQRMRDTQVITILLSFIEAHEYAQQKIPYYLGHAETADTPEQQQVVQESVELVTRAKTLLNGISPEVIRKKVSKQSASWILHTEQDLIEEFQLEGILTQADAKKLLDEVQRDFHHLERDEYYRKLLRYLVRRALCLPTPAPSGSAFLDQSFSDEH